MRHRVARSIDGGAHPARVPAQRENWTSDEHEFLMAMQKTWEDVRNAAYARDVMTVLGVRGIAVPDGAPTQSKEVSDATFSDGHLGAAPAPGRCGHRGGGSARTGRRDRAARMTPLLS